MTLKGGTTSACAACKYQRRKCIPECLLAPYFPADQTKVFQNAHKLFGVSNIVKILRGLDPSQHAEAMRSIKYQANVRDRFPVDGCVGVINHLNCQIQMLEDELHAVIAQLEMCRQYHHQQHQHQHQHQISLMPDDVPSQLELGMAPPNNGIQFFNHTYPAVSDVPVSMQHSYSNSNNSLCVQHPFLDTNNNSSNGNQLMAIQSQLLAPNSETLVMQQEVLQGYDEIHPFFESIDDRQSFIDTKEAYDSSSCAESAKETTQAIEHVAESELKSAAACFSLTSVN
ncbi:ASYMMETRIC LEAVES 2-like 29, SIDECAR POLLEN, LOB domain-containing protein 27 [Hibiscus trionum]|uniref:ASYMMETRIC LEAVES 2-like 29, SIDECAR POLLEN, LOB domain-containing protein 27 n=1 Tax=Hibiscus trionum TaxID=183268 RepID=A0A9W7JIF7_HIBTR|nr:ASYMMETRIC LEAVES 2-like 29, SIDECAR POLLEN, LOB domain-containing protein 27 [Hibiscus trionum]